MPLRKEEIENMDHEMETNVFGEVLMVGLISFSYYGPTM